MADRDYSRTGYMGAGDNQDSHIEKPPTRGNRIGGEINNLFQKAI